MDKLNIRDFDARPFNYQCALQIRKPASARLCTDDDLRFKQPFIAAFVGREGISRYRSNAIFQQSNAHFTYQIIVTNGPVGLATWPTGFERQSFQNLAVLDGILIANFDDLTHCKSFREWWHRLEGPAAREFLERSKSS